MFVLAGMRGNRSDLEVLLGAFDHGQSRDFDLQQAVGQFRDVVTERLERGALEDLFRGALGMAWADGSVHPSQRIVLDEAVRILRLSPGGVSVMEEMAAAEARTGFSPDQRLAAARMLLGLGPFPADDEVHSAYRQRAGDLQRLTAQGFPQQINEEVAEALEAVQEAYVLILSAR